MDIKNCPKCHQVINAKTNFCPNCGYRFENVISNTSSSELLSSQIEEVYSANDKKAKEPIKIESNSQFQLLLTLSIVSLVFSFIIPLIGIIIAIALIVKNYKDQQIKVVNILSVISLVIGLIVWIY
jgi:ABC-type transport system involved in multi-copper enzyme maturation permease subunit